MKHVTRCLTSILALTLASVVQANPDRISILLGSEHVNATRDFQEFNPGVFLTWERELDYSVGLYYNSFEEISPLISVAYSYEVAEEFEVGAFVAVAVYPRDADEFTVAVGDLVPLAGLQARYKNVFAQFIPADAMGWMAFSPLA